MIRIWFTAKLIAPPRSVPRNANAAKSHAGTVTVNVPAVPVARDSDITTVSCIFALAFAELAMRTGLVPVNQKYAVLFSNSPLRMQIIDSEGNAEFSSAGARPISREDWEKLRDDIKHPLLLHGDTLLYADGIPGGMIVWQ